MIDVYFQNFLELFYLKFLENPQQRIYIPPFYLGTFGQILNAVDFTTDIANSKNRLTTITRRSIDHAIKSYNVNSTQHNILGYLTYERGRVRRSRQRFYIYVRTRRGRTPVIVRFRLIDIVEQVSPRSIPSRLYWKRRGGCFFHVGMYTREIDREENTGCLVSPCMSIKVSLPY